MTRLLTIGYGAVCYVVFLAAFLYSIGFVGAFVVPRTVDHGVAARWWTRFVPNTIERTYVLLEEHDPVAALGERYRDDRTPVPMLIPGLRRHGAVPDTTVRPA